MVETQYGVLNLTRNFTQENIMLKSYTRRRWVQVCLGLLFLSFIAADCPFPNTELPNGRFLYQSPSDVDLTVAPEEYLLRFRCYSGFRRIGQKAIICLEDQWSGAVPSCAKMQCADPPDIENAEYKLYSGPNSLPTLESSAIYTCRAGYGLVNDTQSVLECVFDPKDNSAKWDGEIPACTALDHCPIPPPIRHGFAAGKKDDDYYIPYDEIEVVCEPGYAYKGYTKYVMCEETGSWNAEFGECTEIFCDLPEPLKNGTIPELMTTNLTSFPYNFEITYICDKGFRLVGGDSWRFCGKKGWSGNTPYCQEIFCYLPEPLNNGTIPELMATNLRNLPSNFRITYICDEGFRLVGGNSWRFCGKRGWSGKTPYCEEIFCDLPEPLNNGTIPEVMTTNLRSFPYNFMITYICDKGFRLVGGDSWRFCGKRGWTKKTPYCEEIECPDPGVPEHGSRQGESFKIGDKVFFSCFSGYYLLGSYERYCKPNGQWTGELARCDTETNYCPDPGIPINGFKNSTDYDMGGIVGFRCRPGYMLLGPETRECLPNRKWSDKETKCSGLYDYDNDAEVRDILKIAVSEKAEEQQKNLRKFYEKLSGRNYPDRLILYFVFDVSGSVGTDNFRKSIEFAKVVVKKIGVTQNGARAAAITFSSQAEVEFLPLDFASTEEVMDAFDRIEYTGGGTSTSSALELVRTQLMPLNEAVLGRKGQKSVIFVLTDGRVNMGGNPQREAEILKHAGVEIYCIGITGNFYKDSLYKIASHSDEEPHVFILENYSTLFYLIQEITNGTIDYSKCGFGLGKVGSGIHRGRITGGSSADEPWPWMVAVYFLPHGTVDPSGAELQCGGSIIHERFILTAAHCMYAKELKIRNVKEIIVKLGLTHVKNESFVQEPEVQTFFIHPKYRPGAVFDYDIALLQLRTSIEFNKYVRPICLPPVELPADTAFYKANEFGLAIGWGHEGVVFQNRNARIKSTDKLKQVLLPIQSNERCIQSLVDNNVNLKLFTERMFCAGDGLEGNDTCHGDSGGPLMQSQLNSEDYLYWSQVGIVSWGIGCGMAKTYGFYSHVQQLRPWVDDTIEKAINQKNV